MYIWKILAGPFAGSVSLVLEMPNRVFLTRHTSDSVSLTASSILFQAVEPVQPVCLPCPARLFTACHGFTGAFDICWRLCVISEMQRRSEVHSRHLRRQVRLKAVAAHFLT